MLALIASGGGVWRVSSQFCNEPSTCIGLGHDLRVHGVACVFGCNHTAGEHAHTHTHHNMRWCLNLKCSTCSACEINNAVRALLITIFALFRSIISAIADCTAKPPACTSAATETDQKKKYAHIELRHSVRGCRWRGGTFKNVIWFGAVPGVLMRCGIICTCSAENRPISLAPWNQQQANNYAK